MVFGDVVVEVNLFSSSFGVRLAAWLNFYASLTDVSGLAVGAFDLLNCSWSVFRFVFVLNISE